MKKSKLKNIITRLENEVSTQNAYYESMLDGMKTLCDSWESLNNNYQDLISIQQGELKERTEYLAALKRSTPERVGTHVSKSASNELIPF